MKIAKIIMTVTFILSAILVFSPIGNSFERLERVSVLNEDDVLSENILAKKNITLTFYNPVREQCDKDPHITADGSKIDLKKLHSGQLRWCAVSRDLLDIYNYGDEIWIESENPQIRGYWIVKDTMNKKKVSCIDLLLPVGHKTGFGKEHTYIKHMLPRYLAEELGWEVWKEKDPHYLENTLSDEDGLSERMLEKGRNDN
jgi:3D (Asp-Asp-Asp) domain-containing protein